MKKYLPLLLLFMASLFVQKASALASAVNPDTGKKINRNMQGAPPGASTKIAILYLPE